jgi:hypothetical protein
LGRTKADQPRTKEEFQRDAIKIIKYLREDLETDAKSDRSGTGIELFFLPKNEIQWPSSPKARSLRDQIVKVTTIDVASEDDKWASVGECTAPLAGTAFTCKDD